MRSVTKDVADVYCLLRATPRADLEKAVLGLPQQNDLRRVAQKGATYLRETCGERGPGAALLRRLLRIDVEAENIVFSLSALIDEFCSLLKANI
jgi:hypothetical protein